jgi:tRNA(Ile)-lysidine synthase
VLLRLLRGSGVRGLAALLAPSPILRPLLRVRRSTIASAAAAEDITYMADPSNEDLTFLRNRARLEILPALEATDPGFADWLWSVGERAAAWRAEVATLADKAWAPTVEEARAVRVRRRRDGCSAEEAALLWPEVAGRIGVALDRRGTERLASFTTTVGSGRRVPLSGGVEVRSERGGWVMERVAGSSAVREATQLAGTTTGAFGL